MAIDRLLTARIKNRHNERPADALPQWHAGVDPEADDEKVRSMLRRAAAETMVASSGDVVEGACFLNTSGSSRADVCSAEDDIIDPNDVASDSD